MFRKIRRILAHKSIKKFLSEFMPDIGLGNVYLFECVNFRLGDYAVHTSKGRYKVTFWELVSGAKEIILELRYESGEGEFITFTITGNGPFVIMPATHTIDKRGERQVVNLLDGTAKVYPSGSESDATNYKMIEYKRHIMKSEILDIYQLVKETYNYLM